MFKNVMTYSYYAIAHSTLFFESGSVQEYEMVLAYIYYIVYGVL